MTRDDIIKPTNSIRFYSDTDATEVLRLSREGIWANPEIPADETAKLVLEAIDYNIKVMVQKAVEEEREACAELCERMAKRTDDIRSAALEVAAENIRARGNT